MQVLTDRLTLIPLTQLQFKLLLENPATLEQSMHWLPSSQLFDQSSEQAMQWRYWQGVEHPDDFIWYTNWQIIHTTRRQPVGMACFQGPPTPPDFTVELGYRIDIPFRRQGYMAEAARALCRWAIAQPSVRAVSARTEEGNYPSEGVLRKCGMQLQSVQDGIRNWLFFDIFCT